MKPHNKIDRRTFIKVASANASLLGAVRSVEGGLEIATATRSRQARANTFEVVVVGAGAFGGWTALYLREMGVSVTMIDQYGSGKCAREFGRRNAAVACQSGRP